MSSPERQGQIYRWYYHLTVLAIGSCVFAYALAELVRRDLVDQDLLIAVLVGVPLIAGVARFPIVLDSGAGGIEVGFESSVLMFMLCTLDWPSALVVWTGGVVLTQLTFRKSTLIRVFNIGLGVIAGGLAAAIFNAVVDGPIGTPRGLLGVTLAAAAYFLTDYVMSGLSVALYSRAPLRRQLVQSGSLLAIACFVPFDLLGYLGAVVQLTTPWWTLTLLGVPLATLLIAARAVTRGREDARRLGVLFDAAVRAQSLADRKAVMDALVQDAGALLRLPHVRLLATPPASGEIGVRVQLGDDVRWLVARAGNRARSTAVADDRALRALSAVASDAVARLDLTDEMVHIARHDPLTDLPNRGILLDRVTWSLEQARRNGTRAALLFIDLDGFKPVNDRYGHSAGDEVLLQLAERLRGCVRPTDTVARLGGDEFAILIEDLDDVDLSDLCERVLAAIAEGADVSGQHLELGASVGLAYGGGEDSAARLLRNADLAMYEAKARGKGRYVEYESAMGQARVERLELVDDLRQALETDELEVAYQPVVDAMSGQIVGAEALARWRRDGVPVPPDVFITAAEETGLIVALGDAILAKVADDTPALLEAAGQEIAISVNISAAQLLERGFVGTVALAVSRMRGATLVLEITERQGIDLTGPILAAMRAITDMGVLFAIDDFGVGFSSISYLHDLPAQIIKVDAALSENVDSDERARGLLRSVVLMGRALGFRIVIEGIERVGQLAVIREDTPDVMAQGYLLHRPMPVQALLELMEREEIGSVAGL